MVGGRRLRVVFLGTPEFAVPTLDALLGSAHSVVGVVTQPDRPRGRGQHTSESPVKARALAADIPVLQPERIKDPAFLSALAALEADLGVVAAYGKILTEAILATPRLGMINVHASLLPRHRGAAPVHRAVVEGDSETGVTIMRVVKALDAGPMLDTVRRPIAPEETSADVEHDLARLGADLLVSVVDRLAEGSIHETPQDDREATYAARLTKEDGLIEWSRSAHQVRNLIRGMHPWPHAFTFCNGRRYILLRSHVAADEEAPAQPAANDPPGSILVAHGDRLQIRTGDGAIDVAEIQAEGKRPMTPREFLTGHPLHPGDRFTNHP